MIIRKYKESDLPEMIAIWNEIVEDGIAFPQEEYLDELTGASFFSSQSYTGVAETDGKIAGLYILHPNNIGRCGHICNASYAVSSQARGKHTGEKLVVDCLKKGGSWASAYFSSMLSSKAMYMPDISMNGLVSFSLGQYPAGSG